MLIQQCIWVGHEGAGENSFYDSGMKANIGGLLLAAGMYRAPYILVSGLYVVAVILFYVFFKDTEKEIDALRQAEVVDSDEPESSVDIT
ncbi:MAG: hypothetical protein RTU92_06655 [Candidatus Thorarchaeota archaeon]